MKLMILAALAITLTSFAFVGRASAAEAPTDAKQKVPQKIVQTAGREALGDFAPDFARYNDDILFGEV